MRCNCQNGCRLAELRCEEVISVSDGSRLGYVSDVEIDTCTGRVAAIVVPAKNNLAFWNRKQDYVIPWEAIRRIGDDIILTSFCADAPVQAPCAKEF